MGTGTVFFSPYQLNPNVLYRAVTSTIVLTLFLVSSTVSASSLLVLDGGISNHGEEIRSETIDISNDGSLIAVGYRNSATVFFTSNQSVMTSIDAPAPILDIKFSPNSTRIAFSVQNGGMSSIGVYIWEFLQEDSDFVFTSNVSSTPNTIHWTNDGSFLAVPDNLNNVKLLETETLDSREGLTGGHNALVTTVCISADGNIFATGDRYGIVKFWNSSYQTTGATIDIESEILHCEFNPTNDKLAVLSKAGVISLFTINGTEMISRTLPGAEIFQWSSNGNLLRVIQNQNENSYRELNFDDLSDFSFTSTISNMRDFAVIESSNGGTESLYLATDTQEVSQWKIPTSSPYSGMPGADLDGDGIPDIHDDDDDGDGIIDGWDFNCEARDETCARVPDEDTIRSVEFLLNNTGILITERFTIDSRLSSDIRNISRRSVIANTVIETSEVLMVENSICANLDDGFYRDSWSDIIEFDSGIIEGNSTTCQVISGMKLVAVDDYQTRIVIEFKSDFLFTDQPNYPLGMTIAGHPLAQRGSITHNLEQSPMSINVGGELRTSDSLSPFWVSDSIAEFTIEEIIVEEPSISEKISNSFRAYPILWLIPMMLLVIVSVALLRKYNESKMDFDTLFEDDDVDNQSENDELSGSENDDFDETETLPYAQYEYQYDSDHVEDSYDYDEGISQTDDDNNNSKDIIEKSVRKRKSVTTTSSVDFSQQSQKEESPKVSKKVVSKKAQLNKDGPITTTKRRTLKSSQDETTSVPKKRAVKTQNLAQKPPKRKVRKVTQSVDDMDVALAKITSQTRIEEE